MEEQHKPEHRHDQRAPDAFVIEQQMVEQNIYDYRSKNRQRQRNIAIDQQQRAANRLHCADRQHIGRSLCTSVPATPTDRLRSFTCNIGAGGKPASAVKRESLHSRPSDTRLEQACMTAMGAAETLVARAGFAPAY